MSGRFVCVFFIVLFAGAQAQTRSSTAAGTGITAGMSNGRAWLALPSSEVKALYLSGVRDAIKNTDCQPGNPLLLPNVTPAQLVPYFDEIYAKPENARIPILYMMPVVKRRLEGQSLSDVETEVSMWRKMSAKQ